MEEEILCRDRKRKETMIKKIICNRANYITKGKSNASHHKLKLNTIKFF